VLSHTSVFRANSLLVSISRLLHLNEAHFPNDIHMPAKPKKEAKPTEGYACPQAEHRLQ
jgi:hypothetical protein